MTPRPPRTEHEPPPASSALAIDGDDVIAAAARLGDRVRRTPLLPAPELNELTGAHLAIKAEHAQHTGSFKYRGALHKLLVLVEKGHTGGVVTASSGNHGLAVSAASAKLGLDCTVVVPAKASAAKLDGIHRAGAEIVTVDSTDTYAAERRATKIARTSELTYVSPYSDPHIMAGQGTATLEIVDQIAGLGWDRLDAIVVAVGGGGLISGSAVAAKAASPDIAIIGAQPATDAVMAASVTAGRVIEIPTEATFSDGTAGQLEPTTLTFAPCRDLVDEWILVDEQEIATAMAYMIDHHHTLVEGASGVAIAAGVHYASAHPGAHITIISCGANVSSTTLRRALAAADPRGLLSDR